MNHLQFWEELHGEIQAGERLMLLLVVESGGSSPGKAGFKLAVTSAGRTLGTVGGGLMEKDLIEQAVDLLARGTGRPRLLKILHREGNAGKSPGNRRLAARHSGAICSGWQRVALLPLAGGDSGAVDSLLFALKRNRPGRLQVSPRGLEFRPLRKPVAPFSFARRSGGDWVYREEAGVRPVLTIIGGGHVGLALSRLMAGLDFHVRVLDDREGLGTMAANEFAQEKRVVSYRDIGRHVESGRQSYAVIMTYGHLGDQKVLERLAGKKLRYLGMLGSPAKNARIFSRLERRGLSRRVLAKVRAPAGLPIHSHTPEEIAVSIAAEIIAIKNQPKQS